MSSQPRLRVARRALIADLDPVERRGWLSHGIAALAISALGLAVAGSVALSTQAEVSSGSTTPNTSVRTATQLSHPTSPSSTPASAKPKQPSSLRAFSEPQSAAESSHSVQLQAAIVKERSAQRAENLARAAEDVSRAARDEAGSARQAALKATDRAIRENAVQLAWARQQRAIAARVAAETARADAEAAATTQTTTTAAQTVTTTQVNTVPTGGAAVSPVPGAVIGARFGEWGSWSRYHTGLDFRAGMGTPIRAVKAGLVLYAGNSGDWAGNHVAIRHGGGVTTMSSHMSAIAVHAGQTVQAGQVIGYVGETGRAFGPHLHFELYPVGVRYGDVYKAIDPQPWLRANGVQTH